VAVGVLVAVGDGSGVGGLPVTVKRPEFFHSVPTKIWTSYSPASHSSEEGWHSV
jgi:hypothetical protein